MEKKELLSTTADMGAVLQCLWQLLGFTLLKNGAEFTLGGAPGKDRVLGLGASLLHSISLHRDVLFFDLSTIFIFMHQFYS
jgi:hypothetical protein